jgi:acetolactate synthase-1/2/3 large subunit
MKVSEYVLDYLKKEGVKHAFLITGGSIAPMIDSFDKDKNLEFICTTHEQGAAMAAEAYSRITQNLGVAMSTSGPGATNLITGIACAFFDSTPTLYITGQVNPYESTWQGGPRQVGFQETNVIEMVKPITKYASRVDEPKEIRRELEKAIYIAKSGRPGPVLLDLPFNTQAAQINKDDLESYVIPEKQVDYKLLDEKVNQAIDLIENAERPVIILGAGVKIANSQKRTRDLIEKLRIPVICSWGALDVLSYDHPQFVEGFGVAHNRAGNLAVQNSDLIISLGSRLDTRQTGGKRATFARGAKKVVLDIDSRELYKGRGLQVDIGLDYDINDFLDNILKKVDRIKTQDLSNWKGKINDWKARFPICLPEYFKQEDKVNPYVFMDALSDQSKEGDIIIADTGANLMWTMQGWKTKEGQRVFSAFGHSPMGYSVPASIGASFASNKGPITCITGDGGIKMNINELETIVRHNLPIKIFLINNHELGTIKQFQDTLFNSRYKASSIEGGLGDSDLLKIGEAYGLKTLQINNHKEMTGKIKKIFEYQGPVLCSVELKHGEKVTPKVEFGRPIEDPVPLLDREEFKKIMIVPPLEDKK